MQQFRGRPYANISCEHLNIVFGAWTFWWWMKEKISFDRRRIKLIHAAAILHGTMWSRAWCWKTETIMELTGAIACIEGEIAPKRAARALINFLVRHNGGKNVKKYRYCHVTQQLECEISELWTPRYCWLCQNKQYIERFYWVCLSHPNSFCNSLA